MTFRQRLAWLLLFSYLCATLAVIYYIFEINEHFSIYAVEHAESYHDPAQSLDRTKNAGLHLSNGATNSSEGRHQVASSYFWFFNHVADLPFVVLAVAILLIYLQGFCLLWMFTRSDPQHCFYCVLLCPFYLCLSILSRISRN